MNMDQASLFLYHIYQQEFSSYCLSRIVSPIDAYSFIDLDISSFFTLYPNAINRNVKAYVVEKSIVFKYEIRI